MVRRSSPKGPNENDYPRPRSPYRPHWHSLVISQMTFFFKKKSNSEAIANKLKETNQNQPKEPKG